MMIGLHLALLSSNHRINWQSYGFTERKGLAQRLKIVSYQKLNLFCTFIIILHITILEMKFALITWTDVLSLGASKDVLWSGDEICQA